MELSVEQSQLTALGLRLEAEADGAKLRLELVKNLRIAVAPAVRQIKAGALEIKRADSVAKRPTKKAPVEESSISLGAAIARGITTQVRLTSGARRAAGVAVKAKKSGMPRNFPNAPKRINAAKFRHRVYGHDRWVDQVGAPGYFDDPLRRDHALYRAACIKAMEATAARLDK
jgi:hypothetical protein